MRSSLSEIIEYIIHVMLLYTYTAITVENYATMYVERPENFPCIN